MLAGDTGVAAFDASADGTRAISVTELREGGRSSAVAVPGSEEAAIPRSSGVRQRCRGGIHLGGDARRELRLARIAVSGARE